MKRLTAIFLCVMLILTMAPAAFAQDDASLTILDEPSGLKWA